MQRGGRGPRGGRGMWPGRSGNQGWQGGQDFPPMGAGGGMMGGGLVPPGMMGPPGMMPGPMAPGWGPDPMMQPGPGRPGQGMMGGPGPGMGPGPGPGMMEGPMMMVPGPGMMEPGPGMAAMGGPGQMLPGPPFGFSDMGPPRAKRMRHLEPMGPGAAGGAVGGMPGMGGPLPQPGMDQMPPQQQQQQDEQQQRGPSWSVPIANDYCQNFVDSGERPQNFLMDSIVEDRLAEYPVQKQLCEAKMMQLQAYMTPAYAIRADLRRLQLSQETFGTRFDVVLIDPPWEEYVRRAPGFVAPNEESWSWTEIQQLDIRGIADEPSFVFLWCGSEEGLDAARHCLDHWGFRRIEDICWIKTNRDVNRKYLSAQHQDPRSLLVHTKEHCLVGMRGKLTRSKDHAFVHANCDTDIICTEEPPLGSTQKPEELYGIIERFCNGRRRLELFGEDHNIRPGWVTVGKNISQTNFRPQAYLEHFKDGSGKPYTSHQGYPPRGGSVVLVPTNDIIEQTRPKSPPGR